MATPSQPVDSIILPGYPLQDSLSDDLRNGVTWLRDSFLEELHEPDVATLLQSLETTEEQLRALEQQEAQAKGEIKRIKGLTTPTGKFNVYNRTNHVT